MWCIELLQLSRIDISPPQQADSPTFNRAAAEEEEREEEEEEGEGGEEREQEVRVLPNLSTSNEEPIVWKVQFFESSIWYTWYSVWRESGEA